MSQNQLIIRPELSTPFPSGEEIWTCPKTGLRVPKLLDKNVEWRMKLLDRAENDEGYQKDLLAACAESKLYWVNAFGMTFRQWDVMPDGSRMPAANPDLPMITWPIQDELFAAFDNCLATGTDILIDKSRDMGASWCCVFDMHHLMLFYDKAMLLEMSRNEEYVDKTGNMKALFQKHDYINENLPPWMRPPDCFLGQKNRTHMHWENPITGSVLDGESTTKHAGRGDRRLKCLLDEFGAVQNGSQMRSASRDAALVRTINSTAVAGSEYNIWKKSGQIKVFVMPWHEHPEKGAGRYIEEKDKKFRIRSPWYNKEEETRGPKYMAAEVDRVDIEPGTAFFIQNNIENHSALYARPPKYTMDVRFNEWFGYNTIAAIIKQTATNFKELYSIREITNGPLKLWCKLKSDVTGQMRPDQKLSYIIGIDTGKGQGASNSVMSIKCKETGEQVGEWADANYPSYEFAQIVIAIALWFGGPKPWTKPYLKWESNGPGWDLGRIIVKKCFYPYYYRAETVGKTVDRKTQTYGAHTSRQSKELMLMSLDAVLAHGGYVCRSKTCLEEALTYIHYSTGGVGPADLMCESQYAKKTHGDRVIAAALTLEDKDMPRGKSDRRKIPVNSCEYRFQQVLKKAKERLRGGRRKFDFTMANVG